VSSEGAPDGLQQLRAMLTGELRAPIGEKLDFHLVEVERGRAVFEATPDPSVYNPFGAVHGGYAATVLDSACGIAVHSQLEANRGHTTLELKVSYVRGLNARSGKIRAIGRTISVGRRVAFAEATLHDEEGRLCATATSTLLVFDLDPAAKA
jgi:uncharacterized protein (TIGR00369 family)